MPIAPMRGARVEKYRIRAWPTGPYCPAWPPKGPQQSPHRVTPNPKPASRERPKDAAKKGRHLLSHLLPLLSLLVAPQIVRPIEGYEKRSSPIRGTIECSSSIVPGARRPTWSSCLWGDLSFTKSLRYARRQRLKPGAVLYGNAAMLSSNAS